MSKSIDVVAVEATQRPFSIHCGGGKTQRNFRQQCDINVIVERSRKAGMLPQADRPAVYADVSEIPDYQSSLGIVIAAQQAFMSLPARARERWSNDPGIMMQWLSDPTNYDEAIKLGLVEPRVSDLPEDSPPADKKSASKTGRSLDKDKTEVVTP